MSSFKRRGGWGIGLVLLGLWLSSSGWLAAETHWQRARTRSRLPCRPYGYDDPSRTVAVRTLIAKPNEAVRLGVSSDELTNSQCKRFLLSQPTIVNGPVTLSQVGLVVYETGEAACTGWLDHNGGPLGDLNVNRVRIRVRAYGSFRGEPIDGDDNLSAPCLCEWSHDYLVRRDDPIVVQLSGNHAVKEKLHRFFSEIAQLEVDVTVRNSR